MAIQRSIITGSARKSAGDATFYKRIGVQMFRQKPLPKENPTFSVAQKKQQSVFRFMKANIDASSVMTLINLCYDAKPRSGKSETQYNMFYRAFMPHLVAQREEIYALDADAMVDNSIFLGTDATNGDKLTNGILGDVAVTSIDATSITMPQLVLDSLISKANAKLSSNATPFNETNVFIAVFGAKSSSDTDYVLVPPTKVTPASDEDVVTITISTLTTGMDAAKKAYAIPVIGYPTADGALDVDQRYFCADSLGF